MNKYVAMVITVLTVAVFIFFMKVVMDKTEACNAKGGVMVKMDCFKKDAVLK